MHCIVQTSFLHALPPQPDPISLPSAAESTTPVYVNVGSLTPVAPAHSPEDERRGTAGKLPHYSGIGPVDESGIPIAIRTVSAPCMFMHFVACTLFLLFVLEICI